METMLREDPVPGPLSRAVKAGLLALYRRHGWRAHSAEPLPRKCVLIASPHTSNWDFPYFLGLTQDLGIDAHFMAKTSLFRWPMGGFMREMGGVEVDRSRGGNYVQAMIDTFARTDDLVLAIAPEGTRGRAPAWRTGFYRIAAGAGVPIVPGYMDYARLRGGTGPALVPTGDYAADMAVLARFYAGIMGKHPERMSPIVASTNAAD